jgi:hypothetical protein
MRCCRKHDALPRHSTSYAGWGYVMMAIAEKDVKQRILEERPDYIAPVFIPQAEAVVNNVWCVHRSRTHAAVCVVCSASVHVRCHRRRAARSA